eukprot:456442-Rhodomonas_salina.1
MLSNCVGSRETVSVKFDVAARKSADCVGHVDFRQSLHALRRLAALKSDAELEETSKLFGGPSNDLGHDKTKTGSAVTTALNFAGNRGEHRVGWYRASRSKGV